MSLFITSNLQSLCLTEIGLISFRHFFVLCTIRSLKDTDAIILICSQFKLCKIYDGIPIYIYQKTTIVLNIYKYEWQMQGLKRFVNIHLQFYYKRNLISVNSVSPVFLYSCISVHLHKMNQPLYCYDKTL